MDTRFLRKKLEMLTRKGHLQQMISCQSRWIIGKECKQEHNDKSQLQIDQRPKYKARYIESDRENSE